MTFKNSVKNLNFLAVCIPEYQNIICIFYFSSDCLLLESQELIYAYYVLVCCIEYVIRANIICIFYLSSDCLLQESQELIYAYHVLVCCIEYVIRATPSFQLQEPYGETRPRNYQTFFMLNSTEHEISTSRKNWSKNTGE